MEGFDFDGTLSRIEEIVRKVEDPETGLDEIVPLMKRAEELASACRNYLRRVGDAVSGNGAEE